VDSLTPRVAVEAHLAHRFPEEDQTSSLSDRSEEERRDGSAPAPLPVDLPPASQEALAATNAARHDWIAAQGPQKRAATSHGYQRLADLQVSATDPDATLMPTKGHGTHFGDHVHSVVDGGKRRMMLQGLVTPSEVMENQPILDLLWRVRFRWKLRPHQATGDTTYGTIENITALEREGIRAYMPLPDYEQRTPYFGKRHFRYDPERDVYICPQGASLRPAGVSQVDRTIRYKAAPSACRACPQRAQCTTNPWGRVVTRLMDEALLDRVRGYQQTEPYRKAIRKRSVWVEPLFAEAKDWHGLRRFRLRRLWRVNCEALLIASGQNLKRLLSKRGWGRRPLPSGAALSFVRVCWVLQIESNQTSLPSLQGSICPTALIDQLAGYR